MSADADEKRTKVYWTDDEWRFVALALHTLCPELDLVNAATMNGISLERLNQAASMMEPGRQRSFRWFGNTLHKLAKVFEQARLIRDPLFFGRSEHTVTPVEPEPARAVAPAPDPEPEPAAAPDLAKPIGASPHRPVTETRIFWSPAEWFAIATELDRLHPNSKYPERGTCGALTTNDIMQAQRVLPSDRRRHLRAQPMDKLRQPLLAAFKEVRRVRTELQAAQQQEARQAYEERRMAPPPNPYEVAFRPLVDLIAREVAQQLLPVLIQALGTSQPERAVPELTAVLGTMTSSVKPAPKLRIGIVNNRFTFADELRRGFPEFEFTFVENEVPNMISSLKNCDRVIVMTKFISHHSDGRARKAAADRYVPINGSLTDLKRVLSGWQVESPARACA